MKAHITKMNGGRIVIWRLMFLLISGSLVAGIPGYGTMPASAAPPKAATQTTGGTLIVAIARQYAESLDIFNTSTTMEIHSMIYETLITRDYNNEFQPGLADRWKRSKDGRTWTFYLKKGVKFHDGSPFNARVVKWWLAGMQKSVNKYMFESLTSVDIINPHTVTLTFESPFPNVLYNLSSMFGGIMSKKAYEKYGDTYGTRYAVGTGPFMLKEWLPNSHLLLEKNPDYNWAPAWTGHKGPAKVDRILYRIIPEDAIRVLELQNGQIHLLLSPPPPRELSFFQNNPDYFYIASPMAAIQFIGINVADPFLKDIRTRQAIGHALDRDLILKFVYQNLGRSANTYLINELGGNKSVSGFAPDHDPDKAKALLAAAGWMPGSEGVLVAGNVKGVKQGTPFTVDYWTYQEDEYKRFAEITGRMLAGVGIKTHVRFMDNPTYVAQLKKGGHQLILRRYGWDNNDILEWFHHSKYLTYPNYLGVNDSRLDKMLEDANFNTRTWKARDAKYVKIHKYLIKKWYPWAPIRQPDRIFIGRSTVRDFKPMPLIGGFASYVWVRVNLAP